MLAVETRTRAKQLIDYVPDDKISTVIRYIQSFTGKKNEPSVNYTKKAAYEILLADVKPVTGKKISLNGTDEAVDSILKKYESLN